MDDLVVGKCVECHEKFETTKGEIEWLLEKGLKPYKRCKACRDKRRAANSNKEKEGNESSGEAFKDL